MIDDDLIYEDIIPADDPEPEPIDLFDLEPLDLDQQLRRATLPEDRIFWQHSVRWLDRISAAGGIVVWGPRGKSRWQFTAKLPCCGYVADSRVDPETGYRRRSGHDSRVKAHLFFALHVRYHVSECRAVAAWRAARD